MTQGALMPFTDVPAWALLVFFVGLILSGWMARQGKPQRLVRFGAGVLLIIVVASWLTVGGWLTAILMLAFSALIVANWWGLLRTLVEPTNSNQRG